MRVVITDLDGTLLRTDKTISAYTIKILNKCREQGIKIVFATARSAQAAARITALFKPDVFIGYGGGLITNAQKEVIGGFYIPAEISDELIKTCMKKPEIYGIYAINEEMALTNSREFLSDTGGDYAHYRYNDFKQKLNQKFLKISVDSTDKRAVEEIAKKFPMCDLLHYSGEPLSRFANSKAVKWNAVQVVAKHLAIDTAEFAAFGDDVNDYEMIKNCGIGVAVSNGVDAVKNAADEICGANDCDGVAKWLKLKVNKKNG